MIGQFHSGSVKTKYCLVLPEWSNEKKRKETGFTGLNKGHGGVAIISGFA